jgi:short-subunit dehydrogenase
MQLKGQRIVITGASSGIGAEMASLASTLGATVILLARSVEKRY